MFHQVGHHLDHAVHELGGPGAQVRVGDVEAVHLADERSLEAGGHRRFVGALLGGPVDDLVVDVGDVGHSEHVIARPPQVPDQHVEGQGAAGVAEVRVVIDGGTAPVDGNPALLSGGEGGLLAGQAVGEAQHRIRIRRPGPGPQGVRSGGADPGLGKGGVEPHPEQGRCGGQPGGCRRIVT